MVYSKAASYVGKYADLTCTIEHGITVVVGLSDKQPILAVIARLALQNPVQVIVGGNRFDAHHLARIVRSLKQRLPETIGKKSMPKGHLLWPLV